MAAPSMSEHTCGSTCGHNAMSEHARNSAAKSVCSEVRVGAEADLSQSRGKNFSEQPRNGSECVTGDGCVCRSHYGVDAKAVTPADAVVERRGEEKRDGEGNAERGAASCPAAAGAGGGRT